MLAKAGPGRRETAIPVVASTPPERQVKALRRHLRQLVAHRPAADSRLDRSALAIIRADTELESLGGPMVVAADVYVGSRRSIERSLGFASEIPDGRVFLVVRHYAYRDYAARLRLAHDGVAWSLMDARTLYAADFGLEGPNLRGPGRPVTLTFK